MRRLPAWILAVALAGTAVSTALAEAVPDSEHIPVDVRRTTLIVRDVDRSLASIVTHSGSSSSTTR